MNIVMIFLCNHIMIYIINYRFLTTEKNLNLQIVFFGKRKNNTQETFHILEMKAHSETHFENENVFLEK